MRAADDTAASMPPLSGRTALISGGMRGIGRAIADVLVAEGAEVWITTRSETAPLPAGSRLTAITADPVSAADMKRAASAAAARRGLDICVANAGMIAVEDFLETPQQAWLEVLRANVLGVLVTLQAAAREMRTTARGGRLLVVTSAVGLRGEPHIAAYSASKAALVALVEALAVELAPYGITANAVAPGEIETTMLAQAKDAVASLGHDREEHAPRSVRPITLGRIGSPADVAQLVSFLASDRARYITGTTIRIDGGYLLADAS